METRVKNILACGEKQNYLFYVLTLTESEIRKFCEKFNFHPVDICEIRDDELQYYIIYGRVSVDTPELERNFRECIKKSA